MKIRAFVFLIACVGFLGSFATSIYALEISYTYDISSRLTSATYTSGLTITTLNYLYDKAGNLVEIRISGDVDNDGLSDTLEEAWCTNANDADTDDDGINDGDEDKNHDGVVDKGETNPCRADSDGDRVQDGTEMGLTLSDVGPDTDLSVFIPDADPATNTDPLNRDTDKDGASDGKEDTNCNGRVDENEYDPLDDSSVPPDNAIFAPIKGDGGKITVIYIE